MKKTACPICSTARGRRVCMVNNNTLICPACCAKTRDNLCEGCDFYTQAAKYQSDRQEKEIASQEKATPFIREISPDVDDEVHRALELANRGELDKAEKILLALRREHPLSDNVYFGLGVICVFNDDTEKGIQYFDKAIELNPDYVEAWQNKASLHQKRLEIDQMIKSYRKVVELGNGSEAFVKHAKKVLDDMEASMQKDKNMTFDEYAESMRVFKDAFAAMEKSDWDKAITGFNKVLAFDPKHTQTYGNLGICYAQLGKKQKAIDHFDRALELDPKYGPAITNRQLVELLEEGEKLSANHVTTEYYKEMAKKSPTKQGRTTFFDK